MNREFIENLIRSHEEKEWVEYKENWFNKDELGEYISALSNSAAYHGEEFAYFIWGVRDKTREIVGTTFDPETDVKDHEPLKHYLARLLSPNIAFEFETYHLPEGRIVCLEIPAAKKVVTEFDKQRFIRIGSSKEQLRRYPEREANLWMILKEGEPTILNTVSPVPDLHFTQLLSYFTSAGLPLNEETYRTNRRFFKPKTNTYNELAFLFSDENDITCRVSVFSGKSKADAQYSLNDFGRQCILLTVDKILNFMDSFNIVRTNEANRVVARDDIPLFNSQCFREALLNAFIHNDWVSLNAPMVSIFSDRIEILSYGSLPHRQTKMGFFSGKSEPRCRELAEIFLQLRISERSGRGVVRIASEYGEKAFDIAKDFVRVTIPFAFERSFGKARPVLPSQEKESISEIKTEPFVKPKNEKKSEKKVRGNPEAVKDMIISQMKAIPSITTKELRMKTGLSKTSVQTYIRELTAEGKLQRNGSKRKGIWVIW